MENFICIKNYGNKFIKGESYYVVPSVLEDNLQYYRVYTSYKEYELFHHLIDETIEICDTSNDVLNLFKILDLKNYFVTLEEYREIQLNNLGI